MTLSPDTIKPVIRLAVAQPITVWGLDFGHAPALARALEDATCAEDAVRAVQGAVELNVPIWDSRQWRIVNPAHVLDVSCLPFD